ncbi:LD-carboxypeptidase [Aurantibacter sp.]|uniref:S66 peptidase family protein n=1 Tax=Aurantibacter sp. TaxID=2807103 RepID=UPI0032656249
MIKRRKFISTTLSASAALTIPQKTFGTTKTSEHNKLLLPKQLKKGDTIGIIAPGYAITSEILKNTIHTLKRMGFKTYNTNRILGNSGYFSNTDKERVDDLNEMFNNPNIDGILCARGGYGCTRIMHLINYNLIKTNPKVLVGFSDITSLLNGIHKETGLVCFHGPVGSTLDDSYSIEKLENIIINPKESFTIKNVILSNNKLKNNSEYERYTITEGAAVGRLSGGSLTLINALIGTPHEIDFTNAIVCIEDVEEAPYRIDRMLTQLIQGETFKNAAGIVFGVFAGCDKPKTSKSFTLKEVIMDRIKPLGIPAVYGMSFGHIKNNFTFPIGIKAKLNTSTMSIQLLEKAVK